MLSARMRLILLVTVPTVATLIVGLTHPHHLTAETAEQWRTLHIVLLPVFPLIGAAPWLLARQTDRRVGWLAAIGGYGFATMYTALDVLAGIGAGSVQLAGHPEAKAALYTIGDALSVVGVVALVAGTLVAGLATARRVGALAVPATIIAMVGAGLILPGHVWFPIGSIGLLLFGAGNALLAILITRPRTESPLPGQAAHSSSS